jgi:SH3 domain protein
MGLVLALGVRTAWAQPPTPAVVRGADKLVVRRGPGKKFPVFAVLNRGAKVDVQELDGEWARIVTAAGQRGYVNSTFLALPNEREKPAAHAPEPGELRTANERLHALEAELHGANDRVKALDAELRTAAERNKSLDAEVSTLQQELAALKAGGAAAPALAAGADAGALSTEKLQTELARLAGAVEGLQHRFDARPMSEPGLPTTTVFGEDPPPLISAAAVLLGMVGILVGWFLGGVFGRKQERGRRSRIRF